MSLTKYLSSSSVELIVDSSIVSISDPHKNSSFMNMKVLHFISTPAAGGAESFVLDLLVQLKNSSHSPAVAFVYHAKDVSRDLNFEKSYLTQLIKNDIPYYFIGMKPSSNPVARLFYILRSYIKTFLILKKFKPDLIHNHLMYSVLFTAPYVSLKKVFTQHTNEFLHTKVLWKILIWSQNQIIGVSNSCSKNMNETFNIKTTTIHNAVNKNRLIKGVEKPASNAIERVWQSDNVNIGMVGGLLPVKNYNVALCLVKELQNPLINLHIAGEGPELDNLKFTAKNLKIEDQIYFHGNVIEIGDFYLNIDIFLMTSSMEGLPIAAIEASVLGLPIVLTDVGGCAEIISICNNGILVKHSCVESLVFAIRNIVNSKDCAQNFISNAKSNARYFEIERSCIEHIELYHQICK